MQRYSLQGIIEICSPRIGLYGMLAAVTREGYVFNRAYAAVSFLIRNQQVLGSIPSAGFSKNKPLALIYSDAKCFFYSIVMFLSCY